MLTSILLTAALFASEIYPPRMSPRLSMQGVYRVSSDVQQHARRVSQEPELQNIRRVKIGLLYRTNERQQSVLPTYPNRLYRYHTGYR